MQEGGTLSHPTISTYIYLSLSSMFAAASPLLAICITLAILLVAVTTIAIAAIILAVYFAREGLKMHWLACKAYCHTEEQALLPHDQQALLLDENKVEVGM